MSTTNAQQGDIDQAIAYEIYIDLRVIEPVTRAASVAGGHMNHPLDLLVLQTTDHQTDGLEGDTAVADGHWGLTAALISHGANGDDTSLPRRSITDRPNRLRRKPGLWARRWRSRF